MAAVRLMSRVAFAVLLIAASISFRARSIWVITGRTVWIRARRAELRARERGRVARGWEREGVRKEGWGESGAGPTLKLIGGVTFECSVLWKLRRVKAF